MRSEICRSDTWAASAFSCSRRRCVAANLACQISCSAVRVMGVRVRGEGSVRVRVRVRGRVRVRAPYLPSPLSLRIG